MSEVKNSVIKLFGTTISVPVIANEFSASETSTRPSSAASPNEVNSSEEPSKKELTSVQDGDTSHQTSEDIKSSATSASICENLKTPSAETETPLPKSSSNGGEQSKTKISEEKTPKKPDQILLCPRCLSMDTKFCYFNNYNLNQPRHFCKNCQRYWTEGGTIRNLPAGAGRRSRIRNSSSASHIKVPGALQAVKLNPPNGLHHNILGNGAANLTSRQDSPLCDTISSVLNMAANQSKTTEQNGNDHSHGVSVTTSTSTSTERRGHTSSQEPMNKRVETFLPQLQHLPSSTGPYPWNPAVPPSTFYPLRNPLSFYKAPASWGSIPPTWNNMSSVPPQSSVSHSVSSASSAQNSPALGKHSRDGSIITSNNWKKEENNVLIPKTLGIHDPSEAAKSSICSKQGIRNDNNNSVNGGGLFRAFPSKEDNNNHKVEASSTVLNDNPAALSRSLTFHERT